MVCISVSAVTATGGSALTAGHFWKSAKSNQKRFAPPLGASPRLGMPERRHCSVGRREGPSMAQRGYLGIHAEVPTAQYLRSASVVNGASRSRSRSKAKQGRGYIQHLCGWATTIASKLAPTWIRRCSQHLHTTQKTCGSELARDGASPFSIFIDSDIAFASKLAPTGETQSPSRTRSAIRPPRGGR
ncbi:hypothetical protein J2W43_005828 [Pseudomonas brassicacearum]|uniref:Nucleoid-structuring protein H-NS n=1 Tax=Pseudomonas brassicacearum TaxID=930166 RepID=A0AAW8MJK3_9PSED|nr:hypothetical protein [Pseudomonas brassicacearum]